LERRLVPLFCAMGIVAVASLRAGAAESLVSSDGWWLSVANVRAAYAEIVFP
jgi:hypothetical protein